MRHLLKDLKFVKAAASDVGVRTPIVNMACKEYEDAAAAGHNDSDISILYNL
jgi:3-hydroxyisobutyrate dehydrogenase-like beta-hydroxyacid dehydrogenase